MHLPTMHDSRKDRKSKPDKRRRDDAESHNAKQTCGPTTDKTQGKQRVDQSKRTKEQNNESESKCMNCFEKKKTVIDPFDFDPGKQEHE